MLRKSLLTLGLLFSAAAAFAQDNYYYVRYEGATDADYNVNTIITDGSVVLQSGSDEKLSAAQSIPFKWSFYGNEVTQYKASDNGYITFDMSAISSESYNTGMNLPTDMAPTNAIFALWDDLWLKPLSDAPNVKTDVRSYNYGSSPNQVHVIQWLAVSPKGTVPTNSGGNWMYFAIRLYEAGGFDVVYGGSGLKKTLTATIGAQNADGTKGIELAGSPNLNYPTMPNGYTIYKFNYGTQPAKDVEGLSLNMYNYASQTAGTNVVMTIHNLGSETINSVEMTYTVDNGAEVKKTISGLNIAGNGGYATITYPDLWMPASHGSKVALKAWISQINGGSDENTANDPATKSIYVAEKLTQRKVFLEEFSNASCAPCAAQNPYFNAVVAENEQYISMVKYQTWWPGVDPMYDYNKGDVQTRVSFYGVGSVPWGIVDGMLPNGPLYTGAPYNISTQMIAGEYARPGTYDVKINDISFDPEKGYTFKVDYTSLVTTDNSQKVFAAVVEDITYDQAPGTNGETEFHNVMRKMLPNAGGTGLGTLTEGQSKSLTFTYKPDDKVNVYYMRFVTWVEDPTTHEVHNATWSSNQFSTGIEKKEANNLITNVFPNPASDITNLQFNLDKTGIVNVTVMDLAGRTVKTVVDGTQMAAGPHNVAIDVTTLDKGIYILNLTSNGQNYTQKLIVE